MGSHQSAPPRSETRCFHVVCTVCSRTLSCTNAACDSLSVVFCDSMILTKQSNTVPSAGCVAAALGSPRRGAPCSCDNNVTASWHSSAVGRLQAMNSCLFLLPKPRGRVAQLTRRLTLHHDQTALNKKEWNMDVMSHHQTGPSSCAQHRRMDQEAVETTYNLFCFSPFFFHLSFCV
jgi:hypothetical protein